MQGKRNRELIVRLFSLLDQANKRLNEIDKEIEDVNQRCDQLMDMLINTLPPIPEEDSNEV